MTSPFVITAETFKIGCILILLDFPPLTHRKKNQKKKKDSKSIKQDLLQASLK